MFKSLHRTLVHVWYSHGFSSDAYTMHWCLHGSYLVLLLFDDLMAIPIHFLFFFIHAVFVHNSNYCFVFASSAGISYSLRMCTLQLSSQIEREDYIQDGSRL